MLRISPDGGQIKATVHIPEWLTRTFVAMLLLYRRVRYGYAFRLIRMAQPKYAKVDPADYKRLREYEWFAKKSKKSFYVRGYVPDSKTGRDKIIYMHQEILKVPPGMVVDHINHNPMDNRTANLRAATYSQNICNRRKRSGAKYSKYKGVTWRKDCNKWLARIMLQRKGIHLGLFKDEIDAAKAYDEGAKKYHGEFASLNFP